MKYLAPNQKLPSMQVSRKIQPIKKRISINIHRLRNDQRVKLVDKNIKTINITIFCMFEKVEEGINMLSRDIEDIVMTQIKLP